MAFHKLKEERDRTAAYRCRLLISTQKKEKVRVNKCRHHVVICGWSQGPNLFCNKLVLALFNIDHHLK
jgi:hypothetical protein